MFLHLLNELLDSLGILLIIVSWLGEDGEDGLNDVELLAVVCEIFC
jgi:hypothetical protein